MGRNTLGREIYTFVRIHPDRIDAIRAALAAGEPVHPGDWGAVVASGYGVPTRRDIALTGRPEMMFYFEPKEGEASQ